MAADSLSLTPTISLTRLEALLSYKHSQELLSTSKISSWEDEVGRKWHSGTTMSEITIWGWDPSSIFKIPDDLFDSPPTHEYDLIWLREDISLWLSLVSRGSFMMFILSKSSLFYAPLISSWNFFSSCSIFSLSLESKTLDVEIDLTMYFSKRSSALLLYPDAYYCCWEDCFMHT